MLVLEPKAAPKAFRPSSVTLSIPVCESRIYINMSPHEERRPPNAHALATCWCGPAPTSTRQTLLSHTPHTPHSRQLNTHPHVHPHMGPLIRTHQAFLHTRIASVTLSRSVCAFASNQYVPPRGALPTQHPRPSNLLVRSGANIHSPCTCHTNTPH